VRCAALLLLALTVIVPASARAALLPIQTLDGPNGDILELDGVAMSRDGSGGLVYRKRVDGRAHVFAARFVRGGWTTPQRVDVGQAFDSTWPAIGAGDGGRLVVTWVQPIAPNVGALYSASLDPGASSFQAPIPVDQDIGEATATYPSLAMNPGGQAYLVYRDETNSTGTGLPPGYVGADLRLARYDGAFWSLLSPLANRNRNAPVPRATAANVPKVGIDVSGNGLVAWDEPDDDFVNRIWARRLFGPSVGIPLEVSPATWGGQPLRGPADALDLSEAGFGEGAIAFRQQPGAGGALAGPHIMAATIPEASDNNSGKFAAPRILDTGAPPGGLGAPTVSVERQGGFDVGFGVGVSSYLGAGDDTTIAPLKHLDDGSSPSAGTPQVDIGEGGGSSAAWNEDGAVGIREVTPSGVPSVSRVASRDGGTVGEIRMAGSSLGDSAIAWRQGDGASQEIAATAIDAPPLSVAVQTPIGWTRAKRVEIAWDPAQNAMSGVTYSITVDDEDVRDGLNGELVRLGSGDLPDGKHDLRVLATDALGQQTESDAAVVKVDRHGPTATATVKGHTLRLRVRDAASGVKDAGLSVKFGDGRTASASRARHVYSRTGTYLITVRATDRAGNTTRWRKRVRVR
jgi:hypothetical protein